MEDLIEKYHVPENHNTAKTHVRSRLSFSTIVLDPKQALCRDGFRCVISKTYDTWAVADIQEIREKYLQNPPEGFPCMPTICTHILPDSLDTCISTDSTNVSWPFWRCSLLTVNSGEVHYFCLDNPWKLWLQWYTREVQDTPLSPQ